MLGIVMLGVTMLSVVMLSVATSKIKAICRRMKNAIPSIATFNITTLSMRSLSITKQCNDTKHNNEKSDTQHHIMLRVGHTECHN
jgi:hypothetical protein